jgi:CRISPR/Cas system CSM-associated protein Csm5 (group 7 of RAMP superfamily)
MAVTNYRITLTAIGPIHIGTGRTYGKKDYFLHNDKIVILDAATFVSKLSESQLGNYCDFLENDSSSGLQDFLTDHNLTSAANDARAYQIDLRLARARRGSYQYLDAYEFVKDVYGCPYVPGSSVKGMLRTALLSHIVYDERMKYQRLYSENDVLDRSKQKRTGGPIEREAFFVEQPDSQDPEAVNDIMRYISVSDSEPLPIEDLVFVKKYDRFAKADDGSHKHDMGNLSDESYRKGNELNIYRECLKPGTRINLTLSIDDRICQYPGMEALDMRDALLKSASIYKELFLDCFDETEGAGTQGAGAPDGRCIYRTAEGIRCRNHAREGSSYCGIHADQEEVSGKKGAEELVCYLGGGVDFDTKTIMNALFYDDDTRLDRISKILYSQFPTEIDPRHYLGLCEDVRAAGFEPLGMQASYKKDGRLRKGKDDHRHWRDKELGVSPHTLKLGKIGGDFYPMGKCHIDIRQL